MKNMFRKESFIVFLFLVVIVLPVFDMRLKLDRFTRLNENRKLAPPPKLAFNAKFIALFEKYFNDNFGFRHSLVKVNFILRHDLLGSSPSKQVVFGKNGWLFYTGEGDIEDYRGITKLDEKILAKWAKSLEMKRDWLEKQDIKYLFVVAPNKSSIYGEFLPDSYNRVRERTALDDLVEYLKKNTNVEFVDIRPALLNAKLKDRVYHKTDTHWNEYGAFIAYTQIMKPVVKWFPSVRMQTIDDYLIEKKIELGGDLTNMVGGENFLKEEYINLKPLNKKTLQIKRMGGPLDPMVYEQVDHSLPRSMVFRDSFFSALVPFFASHFQSSKYYWQSWNKSTPIEAMVTSQKPDIVVEEIVERIIKTRMADFFGKQSDYYLGN